MNTTKKIAVALAVMMVAAAMAAPAAMGIEVKATPAPGSDDAEYTATVRQGQSTSIGAVTGSFGNILRGATAEKSPSFTLTNSGDWDASVEAKFSNSSSGTYGMTNATEALVIPGTSFSLGPDGSEMALKATDTYTTIGTVTDGATLDCDAKLIVPDGQTADAYTGTVLLRFSNTATGGY